MALYSETVAADLIWKSVQLLVSVTYSDDSPACLVFQAQLASTPSAEFSLPYWMKENLLSSFTVVLSLPFIFGVWKVFLDRWQQYVSVNGFGLCLRECYSFSKPDLGLIYESHSTHIVFCCHWNIGGQQKIIFFE